MGQSSPVGMGFAGPIKYQTFHSSNEIVDPLVEPRLAAPTASAVATTPRNEAVHVHGRTQERCQVAVALFVIRVGGNEVHGLVGVLQDHALPLAKRGHRSDRNSRTPPTGDPCRPCASRGPCPGPPARTLGSHLTHLPRAVHFVAEAPHAHVVRRGHAVRAAQVAQRRARRDGCSIRAGPRPPRCHACRC